MLRSPDYKFANHTVLNTSVSTQYHHVTRTAEATLISCILAELLCWQLYCAQPCPVEPHGPLSDLSIADALAQSPFPVGNWARSLLI